MRSNAAWTARRRRCTTRGGRVKPRCARRAARTGVRGRQHRGRGDRVGGGAAERYAGGGGAGAGARRAASPVGVAAAAAAAADGVRRVVLVFFFFFFFFVNPPEGPEGPGDGREARGGARVRARAIALPHPPAALALEKDAEVETRTRRESERGFPSHPGDIRVWYCFWTGSIGDRSSRTSSITRIKFEPRLEYA